MIISQDTRAVDGNYRTVVDNYAVDEEQLVIEIAHDPSIKPKDIDVEVMLATVGIDGILSTIVTVEASGTGVGGISCAIWLKGVTPAQIRDDDVVVRFEKQQPDAASAMQMHGQSMHAHA